MEPALSRKIILSESMRDYIDLEAAFLRRAGFQVETALDGKSLMETIERDLPALCILDLETPGMAGDEIVQKVRAKHGKRSGPSFILVSAGGQGAYDRCMRAGADEVFCAPWRKEDLLRKAAALLRIPRRAFARVLVRFEIEGTTGNVPFFGSSINLSRGGVLLEALEKIDIGSDLRLGFFLPGHPTRISCKGGVVRREFAEGGFLRYGIKFSELSEPDAEAVEDFVRRRD